MSKFHWSMVVINFLWFAIVMTLVGYSSSEHSKRIELETENERITSIMDRVVKASMTTRYSMPDCFRYQSEISFLIAEYYGHQVESVDVEIFYQDSSPDSLLAVPPKDSVLVYVGDSSFWIPAHEWNSREVDDIFRITIDSSEVTE